MYNRMTQNKKLLSSFVSALFVGGCVPTSYIPQYDIHAIEKTGRVVSKYRSDITAEHIRYQIRYLDGGFTTIESTYPGFRLNDCVKIFLHETESPGISYASDCPVKIKSYRFVYVVTSGSEQESGVSSGAIIGKTEGFWEGAAEGAKEGAGAPLALVPRAPGTVALYPAIAPFFITVGAFSQGIVGSAKAVPEELIRTIVAHLNEFEKSIDFQDILISSVFDKAENNKWLKLHNTELSDSAATGSENYLRKENNPAKGDTLEVQLIYFGFVVSQGNNPKIRFNIITRADLNPVAKDIAPSRLFFTYQSEEKHLADWSADKYRLLTREVRIACENLADRIIVAFFE